MGLGDLLMRQGNLPEAVDNFQQALKAKPDFAEARFAMGVAMNVQGNARGAMEQWREAVRLQPKQPQFVRRLAWALATNADPSLRDGAAAVGLAETAVQLPGGRDPATLSRPGSGLRGDRGVFPRRRSCPAGHRSGGEAEESSRRGSHHGAA